jgi:hypothetical protein
MKINFKMHVKSYILNFTFPILFFAFSPAIFSQVKNDNFRDKIEKIKMEKLVKNLDLDEKTRELFISKYKEFSAKIKELNQKRVKAYLLMAQNIESGTGLDTLVDQVLNYESQINKERENFAADLKTILTLKQIAIMIVFERKFNTELKKILRDYKNKNINKNN